MCVESVAEWPWNTHCGWQNIFDCQCRPLLIIRVQIDRLGSSECEIKVWYMSYFHAFAEVAAKSRVAD
jgi:hypothetical protein